MGVDILVKKKGEERRFLGRKDDDDGGKISCRDFSVEIFNDDYTFFNDHHPAVDPFLLDDDDGAAEDRRRVHWESQQFLLQEIVEQYHSIGSKLREEIKREIEIARESSSSGCSLSWLRRAAVNQLRSKGFNATLSVSQWKGTSPNTPPGWHEYIEVRPNTQGMGMGKKKQIITKFIVEVGFRDEFRMGKGSEEYKELINQLPEMYIGKWDQHMKAMIRLVCDAAKKSAEEQNFHMGPWRNKIFMQMKWSSSSTLDTSRAGTTSSSSNLQERFPARLPLPTTLKVA